MEIGPRLGPAPRPSFWRQIDAAARFTLPFGLLSGGLVVLGIDVHLHGQSALRPAYALCGVYFWSLYRPGSLPAPMTAAVGLLLDVLGLSPIGLWAVILLVVQAVTLAARRFVLPRGFITGWLVFTLIASSACAVAWAAQSALEFRMLPTAPALTGLFLSVLLYPPLSAWMIRLHRGAAAVERA